MIKGGINHYVQVNYFQKGIEQSLPIMEAIRQWAGQQLDTRRF